MVTKSHKGYIFSPDVSLSSIFGLFLLECLDTDFEDTEGQLEYNTLKPTDPFPAKPRLLTTALSQLGQDRIATTDLQALVF